MPSTLRLPVPMTTDERLTVTDNLSEALTSLEAEKGKKKDANHELNAAIKTLEATVHSLNQSLITGTIEREIEVKEETDLFRGVVVTIRLDTGAAVKERPLEPDERQMSLGEPLVPGAVTDIDAERKKRTDEQNMAGSPDEAEEMRDARLAAEAAEREADTGEMLEPEQGDIVDVRATEDGEWEESQVTLRTELSFEAIVHHGGKKRSCIFDISKHGLSWRWPLAESAEVQRQREIEQLAAEQAQDGPKTLLKKPNGVPKRVSVRDKAAADDPPPPPPLCPRKCKERHKHSEERTPF